MKSIKRIVALTLLLLALVSTMLVATSCSSSKLGSVDAATIRYDGFTITWDAAKNAVKYNVKINGVEYTSQSPTIAHTTEASSVTIEITPVSKKDKPGDTASKTFTKLATIENLYFDEAGKLSWDAVSGASAYIVEVNGKQSEKITTCSYSTFEIGRVNNIRVRADSTDNSTFSYWSDTVTKTYLAAPSSVKFDGSKITWSGYAQAKGYDIYVNGARVNGEPVTTSYYMYEANGMSFNLTMKSVGDGIDVFSSAESKSHSYVYLKQATNFVVDSGVLKWDPVDGATSYAVVVNNAEKTVNKAEYSNIVAGKDNLIKVKPLGKDSPDVTHFSDWSAEQKVHILATPLTSWNSDMNLDGEAMNAFEWEPNPSAAGYEILITLPDGNTDTKASSADRSNFGYAFEESGTYKIQVKAVAESDTEIYDSAYSKPITVIRLAPPSPDQQSFLSSNPEDLSKGFTATFVNDAKALGYAIYKDGSLVASTANGSSSKNVIKVTDIVNSNDTTRQEYHYTAQAIGSGKETVSGGDRIVTLSSLSSKNYPFTITVLSTPTDLVINGSILTWSNVQGANGYKVAGIGTGAQVPTETVDFSQMNIDAGDYSATVRARGNGSDVLPSPVSAYVRIRKLAAPTDIHVVTSGESEGALRFDDVRGATSYNVYFNGATDPVNSNNVDNVYEHVTVTGVKIEVVAVADSYDDAEQIHCLTSDKSKAVVLTKLATPYFPETPHNNKALLWVGPTNVNSAPGYHVFTGTGLAYSGVYNGTEFDLSGFDAGTYTFYVQAVGDGRTTINSDKSEPVTITKLEQPTVALNKDQGVYYWQGVSDAQRYVVRVNGEVVKTIPAEGGSYYYSYAPVDVFTAITTYSVTVTATSDSDIDSKPYTIEQSVKQLSAPDFTIKYSEPAYTMGGKIQVSATATDPNANGFVFSVGGATSEPQASGTYEHTVNATGNYTVVVVSVGAKFDSNGIYYINSPTTSSKSLRILGSVSTTSIKLSPSGKLSWNAVDGAVNGYEVEVTYDDGTTETFTASAGNPSVQFTLYNAEFNPTAKFDISQAANYTFRIRALGNSSGTIVTSEWVTWSQGK